MTGMARRLAARAVAVRRAEAGFHAQRSKPRPLRPGFLRPGPLRPGPLRVERDERPLGSAPPRGAKAASRAVPVRRSWRARRCGSQCCCCCGG